MQERKTNPSTSEPENIEIEGAHVHNLKNISLKVPLHKIVAIAGVSGSGKSSLALGVLYAEGSRRYLEALSTYTRRRMTQASKALVNDIRYVPAALALHQRPGVPGIRSTFGTSSELLNSLRLMFSRLASHRCPNGHYLKPTLLVAEGKELTCPICHVSFYAPSAEELAFNSQGACPKCQGTGTMMKVDQDSLVPDKNLTIEEGAVAPWNSLMWSLMVDVCRAMGVRTNIPFKDLSAKEQDIVYNGPAIKKHILYHAKSSNDLAELDFTYYNANYTVLNALKKVKDEKGMARVRKFLKEEVCDECHGSRLSEKARYPLIDGLSLDKVTDMSLSSLISWVKKVPLTLPMEMKPMADSIISSFLDNAKRLLDLGLSYLTLDRSSQTLSTGERQRIQLARAVRNRTTGVLYVLDEPSIGLHPYNLLGLTEVMDDLVRDGNSVVLVDHDTQVLNHADYLIEMGPNGGKEGGEVLAQGTIKEIEDNPISKIGPYLSGKAKTIVRDQASKEDMFKYGKIHLVTSPIHTVKALDVTIPKGRMTVVTGVSGSGKTTLVLESLIPALNSLINKTSLPSHIKKIEAEGITRAKVIDATPIGINIRSTVATYAEVHDELRKIFAKTPLAKEKKYTAGDFSYNTGKLRCQTCDGTGSISLDIQFLPDVDIPCPSCHGSRYASEAMLIKRKEKDGNEVSLPSLMDMSIDEAMEHTKDLPLIYSRLKSLSDLGLGYLTLGEATPSLSGGEAQRLKLAYEMKLDQKSSLFVFDEPTIGLHPLDVKTLLEVFDNLVKKGATIIIIEHDLDVISNADYIIDMGPLGGNEGGEVVAFGTPKEIANNPKSITGKFLKY